MTEDNRASRDVEEPIGPPTEDADSRGRDDDVEEGPVRRPLIRATLTPPEGAPPVARQPPVFTMHQQQARGGSWNGRSNRDSGHPNKKKAAHSRRGAGGGGNKWPSRSEHGGSKRTASSRHPTTRRDKDRSR